MKKIAIILSGCGVFDGSEIHESVLTMLAINRAGAEYTIFAPDIEQYHVINHITGEEMPESRNVLIESARIARGNIHKLTEYKPSKFDALIFPGGFGVAKNLCTFAFDGADCSVDPRISKAILSTVEMNKPIGALCISPALITKVIGEDLEVTIGKDKETAEGIEKMDGVHKLTDHGQVIVDEKHKVVTTPCYMLDATIGQIADGAENIVKIIMQMI
ncbi:MAG: isoprenoid biosynthesis glyoxalase ElbB [Bacteroidota bacterium]|nr:isoprenoid biosynthesis glyoxalase ElbB [Bacteroidota bacterium]